MAREQSPIAFPISAANADGYTGVHRVSVTAAGSVELPAGMAGKYLRVQAVGTDIQVAVSYGAAAPTLVANQASAPGTGNAAAGVTIANGSFIDGLIPTPTGRARVWLCWVPVSSTGSLEFWCSEALQV